jgi:hypothetical protein
MKSIYSVDNRRCQIVEIEKITRRVVVLDGESQVRLVGV